MPKKTVAERVAEKFIKLLEEGNLPPWKKGWTQGEANEFWPKNAISNKVYRGANIWILNAEIAACGYEDNRWLTYKQAKDRGGHVRKGEYGTGVIFWKIIDVMQDDPLAIVDLAGDERKTRVISRLYTVFNVEQTEDVKLPERRLVVRDHDHDPIAEAEAIYQNMKDAPPIRYFNDGFEDDPGYAFESDVIWMPKLERYEDPHLYYHTLFHEMVHATGHETRLDRPLTTIRDNENREQYAVEELIAEMGASMLGAHCGIVSEMDEKRSATYIKSFLRRLKDDPSILIQAGQHSQKAYDYIMEPAEEDGED